MKRKGDEMENIEQKKTKSNPDVFIVCNTRPSLEILGIFKKEEDAEHLVTILDIESKPDYIAYDPDITLTGDIFCSVVWLNGHCTMVLKKLDKNCDLQGFIDFEISTSLSWHRAQFCWKHIRRCGPHTKLEVVEKYFDEHVKIAHRIFYFE